MGPTATGKTGMAVRLVNELPLDIVSVDSALVYRGMDIGTAKPDAGTLARAPHRLVDIRDPEDAYSAGTFVRDACREIEAILAARRIPLLVGGTMLYYRSLIHGIARLPGADPGIRAELDAEADDRGWPAMHAELASVDRAAAARIQPNDRQRIQRALEIYRGTGRSLSDWQQSEAREGSGYDFLKLALVDSDRSRLHARINARFEDMLAAGFLDEVRALMARPGLGPESPSMRSVGYRQLWAHLEGQYDIDAATKKAQAATRQLAKRQMTWLRGESGLAAFDSLDEASPGKIFAEIERKLNK